MCVLVSLISEYSLPQWNMSGRNTPSYSNTYHNDAGNLRSGVRMNLVKNANSFKY